MVRIKTDWFTEDTGRWFPFIATLSSLERHGITQFSSLHRSPLWSDNEFKEKKQSHKFEP